LSGENSVVLVNENVIAHNPYGDQGGWNDSEHAGGEKLASRGGGILGEENNKEAGSNAHWGKEHNDNNREVPVDVLVKDQEEVHGHHVDGKKNGESTNAHYSALNWETSTAWRISSIFVGASAKAAAAWGQFVLSRDREAVFVDRFFGFIFGSHHRLHIVHLLVVHIKIW
jgi:hypothetical protein